MSLRTNREAEAKVKVAFGRRQLVPGARSPEDPLISPELVRDKATPYRFQHDDKMNTAEARDRRQTLKTHPLVKRGIDNMWMLTKHDAKGRMQKAEYVDLFVRLCKMLNPDFNVAEATKVVSADFELDAKGKGVLRYDQFYNAMFELVDIWVPDISAKSYSEFLSKAFARVTTRGPLPPDKPRRASMVSVDQESLVQDLLEQARADMRASQLKRQPTASAPPSKPATPAVDNFKSIQSEVEKELAQARKQSAKNPKRLTTGLNTLSTIADAPSPVHASAPPPEPEAPSEDVVPEATAPPEELVDPEQEQRLLQEHITSVRNRLEAEAAEIAKLMEEAAREAAELKAEAASAAAAEAAQLAAAEAEARRAQLKREADEMREKQQEGSWFWAAEIDGFIAARQAAAAAKAKRDQQAKEEWEAAKRAEQEALHKAKIDKARADIDRFAALRKASFGDEITWKPELYDLDDSIIDEALREREELAAAAAKAEAELAAAKQAAEKARQADVGHISRSNQQTVDHYAKLLARLAEESARTNAALAAKDEEITTHKRRMSFSVAGGAPSTRGEQKEHTASGTDHRDRLSASPDDDGEGEEGDDDEGVGGDFTLAPLEDVQFLGTPSLSRPTSSQPARADETKDSSGAVSQRSSSANSGAGSSAGASAGATRPPKSLDVGTSSFIAAITAPGSPTGMALTSPKSFGSSSMSPKSFGAASPKSAGSTLASLPSSTQQQQQQQLPPRSMVRRASFEASSGVIDLPASPKSIGTPPSTAPAVGKALSPTSKWSTMKQYFSNVKKHVGFVEPAAPEGMKISASAGSTKPYAQGTPYARANAAQSPTVESTLSSAPAETAGANIKLRLKGINRRNSLMGVMEDHSVADASYTEHKATDRSEDFSSPQAYNPEGKEEPRSLLSLRAKMPNVNSSPSVDESQRRKSLLSPDAFDTRPSVMDLTQEGEEEESYAYDVPNPTFTSALLTVSLGNEDSDEDDEVKRDLQEMVGGPEEETALAALAQRSESPAALPDEVELQTVEAEEEIEYASDPLLAPVNRAHYLALAHRDVANPDAHIWPPTAVSVTNPLEDELLAALREHPDNKRAKKAAMARDAIERLKRDPKVQYREAEEMVQLLEQWSHKWQLQTQELANAPSGDGDNLALQLKAELKQTVVEELKAAAAAEAERLAVLGGEDEEYRRRKQASKDRERLTLEAQQQLDQLNADIVVAQQDVANATAQQLVHAKAIVEADKELTRLKAALTEANRAPTRLNLEYKKVTDALSEAEKKVASLERGSYASIEASQSVAKCKADLAAVQVKWDAEQETGALKQKVDAAQAAVDAQSATLVDLRAQAVETDEKLAAARTALEALQAKALAVQNSMPYASAADIHADVSDAIVAGKALIARLGDELHAQVESFALPERQIATEELLAAATEAVEVATTFAEKVAEHAAGNNIAPAIAEITALKTETAADRRAAAAAQREGDAATAERLSQAAQTKTAQLQTLAERLKPQLQLHQRALQKQGVPFDATAALVCAAGIPPPPKDPVVENDVHAPYAETRSPPVSIWLLGKLGSGVCAAGDRLTESLELVRVNLERSTAYARSLGANAPDTLRDVISRLDSGATLSELEAGELLLHHVLSPAARFHGYLLDECLPGAMLLWAKDARLAAAQLWPPLLTVQLELSDDDALLKTENARVRALARQAASTDDADQEPVASFEFPLGVDEGVTPPSDEEEEEEEEPEEENAEPADEAEDEPQSEAEAPEPAELDAAQESLAALRQALPSTRDQRSLLLPDKARVQLSDYSAAHPLLRSVLKSFPASQTSRQLLHLSGLDSDADISEAVLHALGQQKYLPRAARVRIPADVRTSLPERAVAAQDEEPLEPAVFREEITRVPRLAPTLAHIKERMGVWQQFCPVALRSADKLEFVGLDYTASFKGSLYCLKDKQALETFLRNPAQYVGAPPALPSKYTVAIVGGTGIGKHTLANALAAVYGFEIMDANELPAPVFAPPARDTDDAEEANDADNGGRDGTPDTETLVQTEGGMRVDLTAPESPSRPSTRRSLSSSRPASSASASSASSTGEQQPQAQQQQQQQDSSSANASPEPAVAQPAPRAYNRLLVVGEPATAAEVQSTWAARGLPPLDAVIYLYSGVSPETFMPTLSCRLNKPLPGAPTPAPAPMYASLRSIFDLADMGGEQAPLNTTAANASPQSPTSLPETRSRKSLSTTAAAAAAAADADGKADPQSLRGVLDALYEWQTTAWPALSAALGAASVPYYAIECGTASRDPQQILKAARLAVDPFFAYRHAYQAPRPLAASDVEATGDETRFAMHAAARSLAFQASAETPAVNFCPVCLVDDARLVVGDSEQCGVRLQATGYSCCSPQHIATFLSNALRYHWDLVGTCASLPSSKAPVPGAASLSAPAVPEEPTPPVMPKLRVLVVGPSASGKSVVAAQIRADLGYSAPEHMEPDASPLLLDPESPEHVPGVDLRQPSGSVAELVFPRLLVAARRLQQKDTERRVNAAADKVKALAKLRTTTAGNARAAAANIERLTKAVAVANDAVTVANEALTVFMRDMKPPEAPAKPSKRGAAAQVDMAERLALEKHQLALSDAKTELAAAKQALQQATTESADAATAAEEAEKQAVADCEVPIGDSPDCSRAVLDAYVAAASNPSLWSERGTRPGVRTASEAERAVFTGALDDLLATRWFPSTTLQDLVVDALSVGCAMDKAHTPPSDKADCGYVLQLDVTQPRLLAALAVVCGAADTASEAEEEAAAAAAAAQADEASPTQRNNEEEDDNDEDKEEEGASAVRFKDQPSVRGGANKEPALSASAKQAAAASAARKAAAREAAAAAKAEEAKQIALKRAAAARAVRPNCVVTMGPLSAFDDETPLVDRLFQRATAREAAVVLEEAARVKAEEEAKVQAALDARNAAIAAAARQGRDLLREEELARIAAAEAKEAERLAKEALAAKKRRRRRRRNPDDDEGDSDSERAAAAAAEDERKQNEEDEEEARAAKAEADQAAKEEAEAALRASCAARVSRSKDAWQEFLSQLNRSFGPATLVLELKPPAAGVELAPLETHTVKSLKVSATRTLQELVAARQALFLRTQPLSQRDARTLVLRGHKLLLRAGAQCVVSALNPKTASCQDLLNADASECFPLLWGHFVLFCSSEEKRKQLADNVIKYALADAPPPGIASALCILGPPLSAHTQLCERMAAEYGLVHLAIPEVLEWARQQESTLGALLSEVLLQGRSPSDELVVAALKQRVSSADCQINGWVLDNFPLTCDQAHLMKANAIVPDQVVSLFLGKDPKASQAFIRARNQSQVVANLKRLLAGIGRDPVSGGVPRGAAILRSHAASEYADAAVRQRDVMRDFQRWQAELLDLNSLFERNYDNVLLVDATQSLWQMSEAAIALMDEDRRCKQQRRMLTQIGRPGPLRHHLISRRDVVNHRGRHLDFCPVCWVDDGALKKQGLDVTNAWEYLRYFYHCCGDEHSKLFAAQPEKYVNGKRLPKHLPARLATSGLQYVTADNCELRGACPVTLRRSIPKGRYEVVPGSELHCVEYRGHLYRLRGDEETAEFMAFPQKYAKVKLPAKLPPAAQFVSNAELLDMGKYSAYLDRSVLGLIKTAMLSADKQRVKYPGLSPAQSALLHMALFLKANNPSDSTGAAAAKYKQRHEMFLQDCAVLPALTSFLRGSPTASGTSEADRARLEQRYDELRLAVDAAFAAQPGLSVAESRLEQRRSELKAAYLRASAQQRNAPLSAGLARGAAASATPLSPSGQSIASSTGARAASPATLFSVFMR